MRVYWNRLQIEAYSNSVSLNGRSQKPAKRISASAFGKSDSTLLVTDRTLTNK